MRAIGLMSGTSLDGVDAAWLDTDGERIFHNGPALTLPYGDALRADLRRVLDLAPSLSPDDPFLADVTARLTTKHAEAVAALGEPADIVGMHGQTILHRPGQRKTWQIGDAAALARAVGVRVAYDFRAADVAAGGEGAPFAPIFHAALAATLEKPLAVLNLGGVANITWIGPEDALLACDTGPGNGPLDDWVHRHSGAAFDRDGALAAAGRPDAAVLARLLAHPFFPRPMPKSLDRLDFRRRWRRAGCAPVGGGRGRYARGIHRRSGRARAAARPAASRAGQRRRPPEPGDHGGAGRAVPGAGRAGRSGRLGRRHAGGAVFCAFGGAGAARPAAQFPGHHRRAAADARRADRRRVERKQKNAFRRVRRKALLVSRQ